jgi:hypothetical protein
MGDGKVEKPELISTGKGRFVMVDGSRMVYDNTRAPDGVN